MYHRGPSYGSNTRPAGAGANGGTRPVGDYRSGRPVPSDERGEGYERLRAKRYNSAPQPSQGPPEAVKPKRKRGRPKKVDTRVIEAAKAEAAKRGLEI